MADIEHVLDGGAENAVVFGADKPQDDRSKLDRFENIEQPADRFLFILPGQVPEVKDLLLEGRPDFVFGREHPVLIETPVFGRCKMFKIVIGQRCAAPQMLDFFLHGRKIELDTIFEFANIGEFLQALF